MNPASQFPYGHVSGRALDTTHIPTPSYVCLLIITPPHQRGLMHNTLVCQPNVLKPQQGDQRDQRGRPDPPCHRKRHPPFSNSWVINYQCLRSLETKTLSWKKSVATLNASVRAKTMIKKNTNLALILARRGKEEPHSMAENALNVRAAWSWDVKNYDKVNQRPLLPLPKRLRGLREQHFTKPIISFE